MIVTHSLAIYLLIHSDYDASKEPKTQKPNYLYSVLAPYLQNRRVIQKRKISKGTSESFGLPGVKRIFSIGILRQRTISVQIFTIYTFGPHQNHEIQTLNRPYLPEKCRLGIRLFTKK